MSQREVRPDDALVITDLKKTFRVGFTRKVVNAVRGISFNVHQGEIFGFLGPNGAGKTTTIKMVMDLIRPCAGQIRLFGQPPSLNARARIGYLPEQPYFYDYLKPSELLDYFGRLHGVPARERRRRIDELLAQVGLGHARDRTLRRFSKGMLQRFGLAQALIGDPEFIILDEPLSGLDPIGRKEMKDIITSLAARGKTVFFSSHILADIELMCDTIAIVDRGLMRYLGPTREFTRQGNPEVEVIVSGVSAELARKLAPQVDRLEQLGGRVKLLCRREQLNDIVKEILAAGGELESAVARTETLEEIFVRTASNAAEAS